MGIICGVASNLSADAQNAGLWLQSEASKCCAAVDLSFEPRFGCLSNEKIFSDRNGIIVAVDGFFSNVAELAFSIGATASEFSNPAELLASLYRHDQEKFLDLTDGSFSFFLFDQNKNQLIAGVDRFGSRQMFYIYSGGGAIFANRLAVLKNYPGLDVEIDRSAVADFLSLQYIPAPETIYRNVKKLAPASVAEFNLNTGECQIKRYWKRRNSAVKEKTSFADAAQQLRALFSESVARYGSESYSYGAFLSGGIDSTITCGCFGALFPERELNLYSLGFGVEKYDESNDAKMNYQKLKSLYPAFELHLHQSSEVELFGNLEKMVANMDEPFGDASLLAGGSLCQMAASDEVHTLFSGDGADELFGGYDRYRAMRYAGFFHALPSLILHSGAALLSLFGKAAGERTAVARIRRFLAGIAAGGSLDQVYFNWLDRAPEAMRNSLLRQENLPDPGRWFAEYAVNNAENLPPQILAEDLDLEFYLPGDGCVKLACASRAGGVKLLTPFLDRKLAEFAAALPWKFKQDISKRKKVLTSAFADYLRPECAASAKRGFGIPLADFLRGDYGYNFCRERLAESGNSVFDHHQALSLLEAHRRGEADHSYIVWNLLVLALFLCRDAK